tara:strand:+ start:27 stop:2015 length:1989 start_codon:yes stop_codon:yes gene_type:complete
MSNNDSGGDAGLDSTSGNTTMGYLSGNAITTGGHDNTFYGHGAGKSLTTGEDNCAFGAGALAGSQDGDDNTAIGFETLAYFEGSNGDGQNTAVGYKAGHFNGTGTNNTYIGSGAGTGASGQSNSNNTAVGKDALWAITTGGSNVAVGANALDELLTGTQNTAIGGNALHQLDAAEGYNVAVGYDTGASLDGGSFNTLLGTGANAGAAGATYQTAIGYGCTAVNVDNTVTIGNASVTAVYMAQDSGATVHCGSVKAENTAIDTTSTYYGIFANHIKTAGASDASDHFIGIDSGMTFNDGDATFGNLVGAEIQATATSSTGECTNIIGIDLEANLTAGDIENVNGQKIKVNIDGGTVDSGVNGIYIDVDLESASTVGGEVVGCNLLVDCDEDPGNPVTGYGMNMQTNADFMAKWYDGANSTIRFQVTAAGQVDAEGSINASQSLDYAEYFESNDGSVIASGTSVKLDGDKIVACSDGDTPLGVIRPKSAQCIVGGSQSFHWSEKYMKDDYGADIWEDYTLTNWSEEITFEEYIKRGKDETGGSIGGFIRDKRVDGIKAVLDDNGKELEPAVPDTYFREHKYHSDRLPDGLTAPDNAKTITPAKQRQKLNPDYDESKTYKSREERDEWHVVGLLGQIPVTKGQPVSDNWIKMKDVSGTVEMYFVK